MAVAGVAVVGVLVYADRHEIARIFSPKVFRRKEYRELSQAIMVLAKVFTQ